MYLLMRYTPTKFKQHSDNKQSIGDTHKNTFMHIHTYTNVYEPHTYMSVCDSNMVESGMNVYVSLTTFCNTNQFESCMNVVKNIYTFKHAEFLMSALDGAS
jgi:hypothetical protein